jgi:hypothetical protein
VDTVKAYVVLHNYFRERDGYSFKDTKTVAGLEDLPRSETVHGGLAANNVRNIITDYFLTPAGAVKWQMSKIYFFYTEFPTYRMTKK